MTKFDKPIDADQERLQQLGEQIAAAQGQKIAAAETATSSDEAEDNKARRVGYELLGAVLACVGIGYLVDSQFDSLPVGTLVGLFAGFIAGVANAWRATNGVERAVGLSQPATVETKQKQRD